MIEFTQHDRLNPLWAKLQDYWGEELAALRRKNDNAELTSEATAALRGEIKQVKAFIAMNEVAPYVDPIKIDQF